MNFTYRHRQPISIVALTAFIVATAVTPAAAEYNPRLGRFMQPDPNGTGLVLTPGLRYHGMNPTVTVSMAYELQYGDGLSFYEYLRSNPGINTDPSGLFSYNDMLITGGLVGGLYGLANDYSHFNDKGSNWKLAASFAQGAGMGSFAAAGFGWLSGALASYAGISIGAAATSIGLMTSPAMFGLSMYEVQNAETYADRVMGQIDVGMSALGMLTSHVALFRVANPGTVSALEKAAARALRRVGGGQGHVHGTRVHRQFQAEVDALPGNFRTEVSYKAGFDVPYGTKGSIRVDVVEGPLARPVAIYDLKTAGSKLTAGRIRQIRSHLPDGYQDIPITEIRGDRP